MTFLIFFVLFLCTECGVHDKYAAKISQSFFEEYKNNPNRSVAEIMRYLKQHSVKNFLAAKTEENMSLLLCTFMYKLSSV